MIALSKINYKNPITNYKQLNIVVKLKSIMKKITLSLTLLLSMIANAQGFVNGSFESTTSVGCDYNNSMSDFNLIMNNVVMFSGTETDIHEDGCYLTSIIDGEKQLDLQLQME